MRLVQLQIKDFVCEVCGDGSDNATTVGVESDSDVISPIRLCHRCGPIDTDLMQLCREITIRLRGQLTHSLRKEKRLKAGDSAFKTWLVLLIF
jgi:hypothetical protein